MIHELTPRIYNQGMKWSLLPNNKIRTVNLEPVLGSLSTEPEGITPSVGDTKFTTAEIRGAATSLSDVDAINAMRFEAIHHMSSSVQALVRREFAKGRIDAIMGRGSRMFKFSNPIQGMPSAEISLHGTSMSIPKGESSFDSLPTADELRSNDFDLVQWIKSHATSQDESLSWNYFASEKGVAFAPWISKFELYSYGSDTTYAVDAGNIATRWLPDTVYLPGATGGGTNGATSTTWNSYCNISNGDTKRIVSSTNLSTNKDAAGMASIPIQEVHLPCECKIFKIDDYTIQVEWQAPIRVAYCAASREFKSIRYEEVDNWTFLDNVTEVNLSFYGLQFITDKNELSFELQGVELLQTSSSEYPYTLGADELFTYNYVNNKFVGTLLRSYITDDTYSYNTRGKLPAGFYYFDFADETILKIPSQGDYAVVLYIDGQPRRIIPTEDLVAYGRFGFKCNENLDSLFLDGNSALEYYFDIEDARPSPYAESLASNILSRYYNGKYTIECSVPATWALQNQITVGSSMYVYDQKNVPLKRAGAKITFTVKNIEKRFKSDSFVYYLQLLEE